MKVFFIFFSFLIHLGHTTGYHYPRNEATADVHHEMDTLIAPEMKKIEIDRKSAEPQLPTFAWPYVGDGCCNLSTTPKCLKEGGQCIPRNGTCDGDVYLGPKYCDFNKLKSCQCCVPINCETLNLCKVLNGTCNRTCEGRSVSGEDFCKDSIHCKCCLPEDPEEPHVCPCGQDDNGGCNGQFLPGKWATGHCEKDCPIGTHPLDNHSCNKTGGEDCKCCAKDPTTITTTTKKPTTSTSNLELTTTSTPQPTTTSTTTLKPTTTSTPQPTTTSTTTLEPTTTSTPQPTTTSTTTLKPTTTSTPQPTTTSTTTLKPTTTSTPQPTSTSTTTLEPTTTSTPQPTTTSTSTLEPTTTPTPQPTTTSTSTLEPTTTSTPQPTTTTTNDPTTTTSTATNILTVGGDKCVFPFMFHFVEYNKCAPGTSQPYFWCATSLNDDKTWKTWDVCAPPSPKLPTKEPTTKSTTMSILEASNTSTTSTKLSSTTILTSTLEPKTTSTLKPTTTTSIDSITTTTKPTTKEPTTKSTTMSILEASNTSTTSTKLSSTTIITSTLEPTTTSTLEPTTTTSIDPITTTTIDCSLVGAVNVGDKCLTVSEDALTWHKAADACISNGGQLVSLQGRRDPELVHDFIYSNYNATKLWLGGSDFESEGNWVWMNGEPLQNFPWRGNQPDNAFGGQNCLGWGYKSHYDDENCAYLFRYICELDPTTITTTTKKPTMPTSTLEPTTTSTPQPTTTTTIDPTTITSTATTTITSPTTATTTTTTTTTIPTPTPTTTITYCDTQRTTICPDRSRCHNDAICIPYNSEYICKCKIGYAGDGADCGLDQDIDTWPDVELTCCKVQSHCRADNCPAKPNSGQEDTDYDGIGDACDYNIVTGPKPPTTTPDPTLECQDLFDASKNMDTDGDGHLDFFDNCPNITNVNQTDTDGDSVGDLCDTDFDADKDGIQDGIDNCINVVNPEQSDADNDGLGDLCDGDADGDGIANVIDKCWLTPGENCQDDKDGDGCIDFIDICPNNPRINKVNFANFKEISFNPYHSRQPVWVLTNGGKEITQNENSAASLMYGIHTFSGLDYDGTLYIDTSRHVDDDYAGFIFAYQSCKTFYVVMWKRKTSSGVYGAIAGLQLKRVNANNASCSSLSSALGRTADTTNQVKLLWHDTNEVPWEFDTSYRWQLIHRPKIGLIRFRFLTGSAIIADSGNIYDDQIKGGRIGVYCHSQELITWSNIDYSCNDDSVPQEVYDSLPADKKSNITVNPFMSWAGTVQVGNTTIIT